ncbi:MAG: methionine ABC transporter ATP-binding protein, partial [Candidatus Limnocylindria bacterium]
MTTMSAPPPEIIERHLPRTRGTRGDRLLEVRGLRTSFHTRDGTVRAVTGVDFHVDRGEVV